MLATQAQSGSAIAPRTRNAIVIVLICWLFAGCLFARKPAQQVVLQPDCSPAEQAALMDDKAALIDEKNALAKANQNLDSALSSKQEQVQNLERDIAGLKMQLLDYEARVQDLKQRFDNQQRRLDAAIVEVVRAKAKLLSLESKAEAASTLAEAEIAVKSLKSQQAEGDQGYGHEITDIEQLLAMSVAEFKARNFGGALFLANQTKGLVRMLQTRSSGNTSGSAVAGESPFAQPLPLKLLKNSNLRDGPGLDQNVIVTLKKDTLLVGYAFKGNWVRVETQDGISGWVFQELVSSP